MILLFAWYCSLLRALKCFNVIVMYFGSVIKKLLVLIVPYFYPFFMVFIRRFFVPLRKSKQKKINAHVSGGGGGLQRTDAPRVKYLKHINLLFRL